MRDFPAWSIVSAFTFVAILVAAPLLGSQNFYSDDLAGHVALVLRMASVGGDPWFYDRAWFSGFAAFELYGFLPHWIASWFVNWLGGGWAGATRAVHAVMFASIVLLPFSAWWFVRAWYVRRAGGELLAGGLVVVMALFLTVIDTRVPAGIQAIVSSGVFAQFPGWVLMLLYLGLLGRSLQRGSTANWVMALGFSLVMATHPLTAVAALMIGLVLLAAYAGWRELMAHGAAMVATSAWFWVPVVAWSSTYGAGMPYSGEATLVSVLLDGWLDFLNGISVSIWTLLVEVLVASIFAVSLYLGIYHNQRGSRATLLLFLLGLLLAGPSLTEAFSLGLHYDRLIMSVFLVTALMAFVAAVGQLPRMSRQSALAVSGALLLIGSQVAIKQLDSHPWISSETQFGHFEEQWALRYLDSLPLGSRVYFEYARERNEGDAAPGKFVESKLWHSTGLETVNGVLIQSSRPYQLYTTLIGELGGHSFGVPSIGSGYLTLDEEGIVDVLRRNSVTHVVPTNAQMTDRLEKMESLPRIGSVGRYVFHGVPRSQPRLRAVSRPVVGYVDLQGNLPFRYMDTFVELRESLSGRIRLVSLRPEEIQTVPVDGLVINTETDTQEMEWRLLSVGSRGQVPALGIHFDPAPLPMSAPRTRHHEQRKYELAAKYLWGSAFERQLHAFSNREVGREGGDETDPVFEWSGDGQVVKFSKLTPGLWYEFAYSMFPSWRADNAVLRQGSAGHWFFRPTETTVEARYDRWSTSPVINGWLLSILALFILFALRFWWPHWEIGRDSNQRGG